MLFAGSQSIRGRAKNSSRSLVDSLDFFEIGNSIRRHSSCANPRDAMRNSSENLWAWQWPRSVCEEGGSGWEGVV